MRKEDIRQKLYNLIGSVVTVYIDRPLGSIHPKHHDILYKVNYGYIKEIIALDGKYQDAYLIGIDTPVDKYQGKVCAIVERNNDVEDKLIVVTNNKEYSIEELKELINFQEQYFDYQIKK